MRAGIAAAQAGADIGLARYPQTVLAALEETANARARQRTPAARSRNGRRQAAPAEAAALARIQYEGGLMEFLQVLDSERGRLDAGDRRVQARTSAVLATLDIFRSLAGGWPAQLPMPLHANSFADAP